MTEHVSDRMRAVRATLVESVDGSRRTRIPGLLPTLGLLLVGALVGGGTSAAVAVAIAIGDSSKNSPTSLPAPLLGDELPGTPIISTVGEVQVFTLTEATSLTVDTPVGASSVSVRLSCKTAGDLSVSAIVRGNKLTSSCSDVSKDVTAGDGFAGGFGFSPLEPILTIAVLGSDGTVGSLTVQYKREVRTPWATNSSGQTYGVAWHGYPDLVAVVGRSPEGVPVVGYVPQRVAVRPTSEETARWKRELKEMYPNGVVPLTTGDGESVVGSYTVDEDPNRLWLDLLWSDIQSRYPEAQRPATDRSGPSVLPSLWPTAMSTCMAGAGFQDVAVKPDGALDYKNGDLMFEMAEFQCWANNPLGSAVSMAGN